MADNLVLTRRRQLLRTMMTLNAATGMYGFVGGDAAASDLPGEPPPSGGFFDLTMRPAAPPHQAQAGVALPSIVLPAMLVLGEQQKAGPLVECIAPAWYAILEKFERDPDEIYRLTPRQWEEIIAGAYKAAGYDEVVLTPRSSDHGRDVIATRNGVGSIRIFDQVKAYGPGRIVTADEVRALGGTIMGFNNVSKGVITTTATFAPRIEQDEGLKNLMPYRLELKPRDVLLPWLASLLDKSA